jgi:dipeptidyl aminopeptidase/acylaminoacyl peptidase
MLACIRRGGLLGIAAMLIVPFLANPASAAGDSNGTDISRNSPAWKAYMPLIDKMQDPKGVVDVALSPDGREVAVLTWMASPGGLQRDYALMLVDADTMKARLLTLPHTTSSGYLVAEPTAVRWLDGQRMAVDLSDGRRDERCVVMGLDGKEGRVLGGQCIRSHGDDVVVATRGMLGGVSLQHVDASTGASTPISVGLPGDLVRVMFDSKDRLRLAVMRDSKWFSYGAKWSYWYRRDDSASWQLLQQVTVRDDPWLPFSVAADSDEMLVFSREGRDTHALMRFDAGTRRLGAVVAGDDTADLAPAFGVDASDGTVQWYATQGLKPKIYWAEPARQREQDRVDAMLPSSVNVLSGKPGQRLLIYSYADVDPGRWYLLEPGEQKPRKISARMLSVDPAAMRPMQTITYPSFDQLPIPAYLTLPAGPAGPKPLVVFVHGGPQSRDTWAWHSEVQTLAAAGYAVFQPQFRGSRGFGSRYEQAGYGQWGRAMQEDITAGVRMLIDRKIADPTRICIYGASYGGYAALWGLASTPGLYRCGISLAGVSDIDEMLTDGSDTNFDEDAHALLRLHLGDLDASHPHYAEVSPLRHADRIHVPVLLMHGELDRRVPIEHAQRMADALRKAGVDVTTHWFAVDGHGFNNVADRRDAMLEILVFLAKHIGGGIPAEPVTLRPVTDAPVAVAATATAGGASRPAEAAH